MPVIDTSEYKRLTIDKLNTKGCLNLLEAFLREASKSFKTVFSPPRPPVPSSLRSLGRLSKHKCREREGEGASMTGAMKLGCTQKKQTKCLVFSFICTNFATEKLNLM
jgi:hypothetical protein